MRTLRIALVAATLVSASQALNAEAGTKVRDPNRYCRTSDGNGWSPKDIEQGIRCAVHKWHVPGGASKAVAVARCESSLNEHNRTGQFEGVFQQGASWWNGRFRQYNPHRGFRLRHSIWNARSNIVISIVMVHRKNSWRDWSCA